jgi:hypothetical protein
MTATANPDRQATIRLLVRSPDEQEREIEAVVEGINCIMTLPPAFTIALGLTLHPMALLEVMMSGEEAR